MQLPLISALRPSADDEASIRAAIQRATEARDLAQQQREQLERDRAAGMLTDATADELLTLERNGEEMRLYAERVSLLLPALDEALAAAQQRDRIAAVEALGNDYAAAVAGLRKRMTGLPAALKVLREAEADAAELERANTAWNRARQGLSEAERERLGAAPVDRYSVLGEALAGMNMEAPEFPKLAEYARFWRATKQTEAMQQLEAERIARERSDRERREAQEAARGAHPHWQQQRRSAPGRPFDAATFAEQMTEQV